MAKFDQVWIDNRLRYRKTLKGSNMALDPDTGYLQSPHRRGFMGKQKALFMERFKVCSNVKDVARSINIDIQAIYDAVAIDPKFRQMFLEIDKIEGRAKRLNDELVRLATAEKTAVVQDLGIKLDKYK